ncbi:TOMM precursor leader peptide-binding protein [Streptomyces otsuchiensis]|uniref:TOMM precursor leader peptide-binding protein n=1 Tax=Streptomyces otsuchiensis TaxID=2681388 RepID=UPI00102F90D7|nr:TOMM precursor leader peptide-binding protein [Streptomyces otsuchiensis]
MAAAAFETLAETRPRIRRDVLYTETPGGVLFHNADGGFHLSGRSAYRFASLIVPHLDGGNRLAEICAGLGDAQRSMVAELVSSLLERDFARDHRPSEAEAAGGDPLAAAGLVPAVAERFGPQIQYIDHYTDDAERRFARYRDVRVAVLGTGEVAEWSVLSLLRNGCARIGVEGAVPGRAAAEAVELDAAGCQVELATLAGSEDFPGAWAHFDVVLVTGGGAAPVIHRLLTDGLPEGRTLIPAWTFGDRAVIGPKSTAGSAGCWSCALLRLGAAVDSGAAADLWSEVAAGPDPRPQADGPLHGPVAAMVGNLLGYEVFRLATGALPSETDRQVQIQDLSSLDVLAEPVHQHPRCRICPEPVSQSDGAPAELTVAAVPTVESARDAEKIVEDLGAVSGTLVRTHTGVFTRFDDEPLTQTPLKVTRLELPLGHGAGRSVAAFDVHHLAGARQRALRVAATLYVDHVVPAVPVRAERELRRYAPDALTTGGGTGASADEVAAWARAHSLLGGPDVLVPLAAVRPFGPHNRDRLHQATRAGAGAGSDRGQAAGHGLLDALAHDALLRAVRGATEVLRADEELYAADPEMTFLRKSAVNLEVGAELLDLGEGGRTGAHVVLARETDPAGTPRWAVAAGLSAVSAAAGALRDLLGQAQLAQEGVDHTDLGDPLLGDLDPRALVTTGELAAPAPEVTFAALLDRLRDAGRDALHVPTTPADLPAGSVFTARILLTEDGHAAH